MLDNQKLQSTDKANAMSPMLGCYSKLCLSESTINALSELGLLLIHLLDQLAANSAPCPWPVGKYCL